MSAQLTLDLRQAKAARDRGLLKATATGVEWIAQVLPKLEAFAQAKGEFRMEEFRAYLIESRQAPPESHKSWGALVHIARARGLIAWTGRYEKAHAKKTHAHEVKIWRST